LTTGYINYEFLTNHFRLSTRTIADIYKNHWQIKIFFREIKQTPRIKKICRHIEKRRSYSDLNSLTVYPLLVYQKFLNKIGLSVQQLFQLITLNFIGTSSLEAGGTPEITKAKNRKIL